MTGWVMSEHGVPDSKLTVVERVDDYISPSGKHDSRWRCICDCGKETVVTRSRLRGKDATKSCGCLQKEMTHRLLFQDFTGQKFGRLTVLERVLPPEHIKDKHYTYWKCQCECGNITVVRRDALLYKSTQSCGCLHDEVSSARMREMFTKDYRKYDDNGILVEKFCPTCKRWLPTSDFFPSKQVMDGYAYECRVCEAHSIRNRYNAYKGSAKHRNLDFKLNIDEFEKITDQPCIYCGGYSDSYFEKNFNGIDRINSQIGYVLDNCVPCCKTCNVMKSDLPILDWIKHIKLILNYYNETAGDNSV